jgi:FkbM family methyltransferase
MTVKPSPMGALWISRVSRGLNRNNPLARLVSRAYGAGLNALYGETGIEWSTNGERLRIHPRLRGKIQPLSECDLFAFLKAGIEPGHVIFDVGTFIGTYAVFEALWSGPSGRVVAFEPTAANWPWIEAHLKMNGVERRVELIKAAAGERSGLTRFHQHLIDSDQNSVFPLLTPAQSRVTEVPMVTLDEVADRLELAPDWIRMDVQGFELSVLRGARKMLARPGTPVRIVAEMHPHIWSLNGLDRRQVTEGLRELGLAVKPIGASTGEFADGGHVELVRA